jgi:hypothetical protein
MPVLSKDQDTSDLRSRIDHQNGLVDRAVFSNEEIYKLELKRVFGRAWFSFS